MADLTTDYMGLKLKNPIVVASSRLTSTTDQVIQCAEAGAGAVVLKSIFEEQLLADTSEMMEDAEYLAHAEAMTFFSGMGENYYLNDYLKLIREAKERTDIPIIASLNCISAGTWIKYAESIEKAGADALELNVFVLPANVRKSSADIESVYLDIGRKLKKRSGIPVSMKIGTYFSGMAKMIHDLSDSGVDALVLFNRFYRPDVDIERLTLTSGGILSSPAEMSPSLQWIALLSGEIDCDFAATTGIHDAQGVIKQLLVGAKAVQLCTTLLKGGLERIGSILGEIESWMMKHEFGKIADFRGMLCQERSENPEAYERSQYVKALVGIS